MKSFYLFITVLIVSCHPSETRNEGETLLSLVSDEKTGTISVYRADEEQPLLVQHAQQGIRPYIHPIMSPDGKTELTQFSPEHHKHQTGLYWGLKELNGRDYFMNWKEDYWNRKSADVLDEKGSSVKWRTVYYLLDEKRDSILTETQTWTFREDSGKFILDLVWSGTAITDIALGKFYVGGLFVRMPWHDGTMGDVVNAAGQRNEDAEGQRAIWNDIGIRIDGRDDFAHIAMLDHPDNNGFPIAWRVDNQLGVGPSRQIISEWSIPRGHTEVFRYRLVVYMGDRDKKLIDTLWKDYVCETPVDQ